ncbi:S1 RNA-binding domain-containing protein [Streptomyces rimosus]|uniref:S1 RNA-binding domain-containing protein n=1 Tax=Streptomyces rimosus TaxID=1927 RepID=UPI0031E2EBBC
MTKPTNTDEPLPDSMTPGKVCRGRVQSVTDYGAFIDLDGVTGFVTVPNITWERIDHPSQALQTGEEITAVVLSVDPERHQSSLSIKDLQPDPFITFARYNFGAILTGAVTKTSPVGIFVRLERSIVGFLPTSEVPQGQIFVIGDEITVKVASISIKDRQVILSLNR